MQETLTDYQAAINWAKELLKRDHFCILDTETTGLSNIDEICQIALVNSSGEPLLNSLVRPTVSISAAASEIHGITDKFVTDAPKFEAVFLELLRALGNRDLVIYNSEFDTRMIKQSIHCCMIWYSQFVGEWNEYFGNYKWQRLQGGDHSALGDCKATLAVIRQMAAAE